MVAIKAKLESVGHFYICLLTDVIMSTFRVQSPTSCLLSKFQTSYFDQVLLGIIREGNSGKCSSSLVKQQQNDPV